MGTRKSVHNPRARGAENDARVLDFLRSRKPGAHHVALISQATGLNPSLTNTIVRRLAKRGLVALSKSKNLVSGYPSVPSPADSLKLGDSTEISIKTTIVLPQAMEVLRDIQRILQQKTLYGAERANIALAIVDAFLGPPETTKEKS